MAIPEAQLYHYRARAYDPMMGRFLQTDPIRYGDGGNIYAYVHGDPVNGTDPSGLAGLIDELEVTAPRIEIPLLRLADVRSFINIGNYFHLPNVVINGVNISSSMDKAVQVALCAWSKTQCDTDLPSYLRSRDDRPRDADAEDLFRDPNVRKAADAANAATLKDGNENGFWAIPNGKGGYDVSPRPEGNSQSMDEGAHPTSPNGYTVWIHLHPNGSGPHASGADGLIEGTIRGGYSIIIPVDGSGISVLH
jgi:uncharacterized protein RhaS with RHS repeats